jgi:hypothetical protein
MSHELAGGLCEFSAVEYRGTAIELLLCKRITYMKCQIRISWTAFETGNGVEVISKILQQHGVIATVSSSLSICEASKGETTPPIEESAILDLHSTSKKEILDVVWPALRDSMGLTCAHIHELGRGFNGCVLDYARVSLCPHGSSALGGPSEAHNEQSLCNGSP